MLQVPAKDNMMAAAGIIPENYWDERPHWAGSQKIWFDHAATPAQSRREYPEYGNRAGEGSGAQVLQGAAGGAGVV